MTDKILQNLKDYYTRGKNVLLYGERGVGKTSLVLQVAKELEIGKVTILSGSTIDPYFDLQGLPVKYKDEHGVDRIKCTRPDHFDNDTELLFIDEFNRSHMKVRNAVLELIQFRSINNQPLPKLKAVWAAINPANDADHEYQVEDLDEAHADRFHFHVEIPYKPNRTFFSNQFSSQVADVVDEFWGLLGDAKKNVSPRRIEYAIEAFLEHPSTEFKHIFKDKAISSKFVTLMKNKNLSTTFLLNKKVNEFNKLTEEGKDTASIEEEIKQLISDNISNTMAMYSSYTKNDSNTDLLIKIASFIPDNYRDSLKMIVQGDNYSPILENTTVFSLDDSLDHALIGFDPAASAESLIGQLSISDKAPLFALDDSLKASLSSVDYFNKVKAILSHSGNLRVKDTIMRTLFSAIFKIDNYQSLISGSTELSTDNMNGVYLILTLADCFTSRTKSLDQLIKLDKNDLITTALSFLQKTNKIEDTRLLFPNLFRKSENYSEDTYSKYLRNDSNSDTSNTDSQTSSSDNSGTNEASRANSFTF